MLAGGLPPAGSIDRIKASGAKLVCFTPALALAKKLGIHHVVDVTREKLREVMRDEGMKEGFDVGLEMSGSAAARSGILIGHAIRPQTPPASLA